MTCREKLKIEHPEYVGDSFGGGCVGCPSDYGYLDDPDYCVNKIHRGFLEHKCEICWDREIPGTESDSPKMKERTINVMLKGEEYNEDSDEMSVEELLEENAKLTRILESKNGLIGTLKETTQKAKDEVAVKEDYCHEMEADLLDKIRTLSEVRRENRVLRSINEILYKRLKDLGEDI